MSILKCKMCGGDLDINAGVTVVECEYCGTKQTVPSADDEKKITLFSRANRLRFACEFDKAAGVYESIVAEFPEEAEAYWGLVLCKYGIEYVDDPATAKKIPTCHRSSFDPVLDDSNFEQVMENADVIARGVYREEAKQIEELRKGIIEVSSKEEPYDIFICYKETADNGDRTVDSVIAQDVYTELVNKGYRVFFSRITLEDKLGQEYEPYIFAALNSAKIMLAFGTDYEYYNAVWVKNEWSRFLQLIAKGEKKTLIPCYKNIDAYDMPKEFAKLQAQDMGKVGAIQDLLRGIEKILPKETVKTETVVIQQSASNPTVDSFLERAFMFLEDKKWKDANDYCDKALDIEPKCAKAYLGKLMADFKISTENRLIECKTPLENNTNYEKILKFADDKLIETIKEYNNIVISEPKYKKAKSLSNDYNSTNDLNAAIELFESIVHYKDSKQLLLDTKELLQKKGNVAELISEKRQALKSVNKSMAELFYTPVALKSDGTLLICEDNCIEDRIVDELKSWFDITKIVGEYDRAFGLKKDGTVVSIFEDKNKEIDTKDWNDIVDIVCSSNHIVGLKSDGTLIAAGDNEKNQCNVSEWKDITDFAIQYDRTLGIKKDGTVLCASNSYNPYEDCLNVVCVEDWVVLHNDGTLTTLAGEYEECKLWSDIITVSSSGDHFVGLKLDGTVVATGCNDEGECEVSDWSDVVSVYACSHRTLAIKSDGTVLIAGETDEFASEIKNWKLFNNINTYKQEQQELSPIAAEKFKKIVEEKQQQLMSERREQNLCQHCGGTFKGLFTKKCSSCGKEKDY